MGQSPGGDFLSAALDELARGHLPLIRIGAARADGHGAVLRLLFAYDQQIGDFLHTGIADLGTDFFGAKSQIYPQTRGF